MLCGPGCFSAIYKVPRISPATIDRIFATADIVEVVSDYVELKKRGRNYFGLSPFKAEKTPSFSVGPDKQIFKDFSSGKGGSVVTFLMELEGFSYPEALEWLAHKYGIEVEYEGLDPAQAGAQAKREALDQLNRFAAGWFTKQLFDTEEGRTRGLDYLTERGFSEEILQRFQVGYSPKDWAGFTDHARKQQYPEEALLTLGLSKRSEKRGTLYDGFRGRVIFPIHSAGGTVVGFGGRILPDDQRERERQGKDPGAKYLNSPDSPVYDKSRELFGFFHAKQAIRSEQTVFIVEGYTDVLALHQAGVTNVVASSGTALTEQQVQQLGRHAKRLVLLFDGDSAGTRAALRAVDLVLAQGLDARVLHLPNNHDPDSFLREYGTAHFREVAEQHALPPIAFKVKAQTADRDPTDPAVYRDLVASLAETVAQVPDAAGRTAYLRQAAEALRFNVAEFQIEVERVQARRAQQAQRRAAHPGEAPTHLQVHRTAAPTAQPRPAEFHGAEREILRLVLNHYRTVLDTPDGPEDLLAYLRLFLPEDEEFVFEDAVIKQVFERVVQAWNAGEPQLPTHALLHELGPAAARLATELLMPLPELSQQWKARGHDIPVPDADLAPVVTRAMRYYQLHRLQVLMRENRAELSGVNEGDSDEALAKQLQLLERQKILQRLQQELAKELGVVIQARR